MTLNWIYLLLPEYFLQVENLNLTAIRTIRVLRPLRAINRIPSELFCIIWGCLGVMRWLGLLSTPRVPKTSLSNKLDRPKMEKVGEVTNFSPEGMRILVMLLLDTLPMLGNVLLLCFFVFFIFGIIGVQLWEGILRQRCVLQLPDAVMKPE